MTKINLTKAALLAATALLGATSVHAQVADNWDIGGDVGVTATNGGDISLDSTVEGTGGIQAASIADGYKNSISNAAVGSSASSSFTAFNNSANASSAVVAYEGGITVLSYNEGVVSNLNDLAGSVNIDAGTGNSISVAAVGSSASGSATMTAAGGTELSEASYTVSNDIVIQNGDGLADPVDATSGGNAGDVLVALGAGMAAPTIAAGNSNSISAAGVGSSASFSLTNNTIDADSTITAQTLELGGAVTVTSSNSGGVTVGGDVDGTTANALIDTAAINGGNANSVSTAGVGSSASFSFANNTYEGASGSAAAALSVGDVITVGSFNSGAVTVQADLGNEANIDLGNGNSISVAGVGSSGSVSFGNNIFGDTAGPETVTVEVADISVATINAGEVIVKGSILDSATIGGGSNNSISLAGVGASASTSFTSTSYDEASAGASATSGIVGGITLTAFNDGAAVTVTTGINTPAIAGGYNNAISAAAVGASASQSMTQNVLIPGQ